MQKDRMETNIIKWKNIEPLITFDDICDSLEKEYEYNIEKVTLKRKIITYKLDPYEKEFDKRIYGFVELIKMTKRENSDNEKLFWKIKVKLGEALSRYNPLFDLIMEENHIGITDLIEKIIMKEEIVVSKQKLRKKGINSKQRSSEENENILKCFKCRKPGHIKRNCRSCSINHRIREKFVTQEKFTKVYDDNENNIRFNEIKDDEQILLDISENIIMKSFEKEKITRGQILFITIV
ncbi:Zinc finger, CCHC-type domain-containing protein [Strongyloides ratti]|uniref:Zinc finger, CCHC-type domain-containing protein n=1 Tax=Strongyloides ratti TaxID=34506 RepID=A0A090KVU4_STRRB|nr:Zinc finger, CCHC-type domain-containing protein [Strongyloides ratti]CEF61541.1 Zinc finger, CCHC-type domain-containing protein [Strongyloides ratti]